MPGSQDPLRLPMFRYVLFMLSRRRIRTLIDDKNYRSS